MFKKIILTVLLLNCFLWGALLCTAQPLQAQGLIPPDHGSCPEGYTGSNCGNYNLDDFTILAINGARWILGIVGSLALIMFVYGGVRFLISGGSSQNIESARKIIVAAIIGLIIVFSSYLIIKFVLKSMGIDWNGKKLEMTGSQGLTDTQND